ncbi:hypothetical protein QTP88_019109 [Uroleucon formosanum]
MFLIEDSSQTFEIRSDRGSRAARRKLLATVPQSIMLYGAPVWNGIKTGSRRLSGLPPSELMAEYRRGTANAEVKEEAKNRMMQEWQLRWDQMNTGKWTYRLIPYVRRWHERKHGMMDYYLTQAFTGHGCFLSDLHRFGKLALPTCMFCENPHDDAKHTLFECDAFHAQRRNIEMTIGGELTPENMVEIMLTSEANWEAIRTHITMILKRKEEKERERQKRIVAVVQRFELVGHVWLMVVGLCRQKTNVNPEQSVPYDPFGGVLYAIFLRSNNP